MPGPENRATARFFGIQEGKKGPFSENAFWGMPPLIGEKRTDVNGKTHKARKKIQRILRGLTEESVGLFVFPEKKRRKPYEPI